MTARVLVAGIGNVFRGDDGFGVEVATRLRGRPLPDWVRVGDFGVAGLHLAYELLDGYELTVFVDALPRGGDAGTVTLLEPNLAALSSMRAVPDAHALDPVSVLVTLRQLGGEPGRVLVVGCEPDDTSDRMGLSPRVAAAVDVAAEMVEDVIAREHVPRPQGRT